MKRILFFTMIALVMTAAACANGKKEESMEPADSMPAPLEKSDAMRMEAKPIADEPNFFSTAKLQPRVIPFTNETDAQAYAAQGPTVYFFAATWCPTCRAMMNNLATDVSKLPPDVTIVLVNYDTQSGLKRKYGIAIQHTWVQIDRQGRSLAGWSGSTTVADFLSHIVRTK